MGGAQCALCKVDGANSLTEIETTPGVSDGPVLTGSLVDIVGGMFEASMTDDEMMNAFAQADTNKDGYLDDSEIFQALQKMGKLTIDLTTISSCMPKCKVDFEEMKQIARQTHQEVVGARSMVKRTTTLQRLTPALLDMGRNCIELYGCDDLTDASLKQRYEQMLSEGYGLASQVAARKLCSRAGNKNAFADFKRAVISAMQMKISDAFEQCPLVYSTGEVIVLGIKGLPQSFESYLTNLEETTSAAPVKFAIYQGGPDLWCIHAVAPKGGEPRQLFPVPWRGLEEDALADASGVSGCISVLDDGCAATCRSQSDAIAFSIKALQCAKTSSQESI